MTLGQSLTVAACLAAVLTIGLSFTRDTESNHRTGEPIVVAIRGTFDDGR